MENYEAGAIKLVSEGEIDQAKKDVSRFCNEWRKRKRACNEIIETICESADLNKRDFVVRDRFGKCLTSIIEKAGD